MYMFSGSSPFSWFFASRTIDDDNFRAEPIAVFCSCYKQVVSYMCHCQCLFAYRLCRLTLSLHAGQVGVLEEMLLGGEHVLAHAHDLVDA